MIGILLSSQVQQYYNLRNLFLGLSALFIIAGIIYGIRIHIIRIIQKHFGIEKRREIARMRKVGGKGTTDRLRNPQPGGRRAISGSMIRQREIDVSHVVTMDMQKEISGHEMETTVLRETEETVVLNQQEETVVLRQENNTGFRKEKDLVIVHGEDIF